MGFRTTDQVRELAERAIHKVGLHVSQGSLIWDAYREFEMAHLMLLTTETPEYDTQVNRIAAIFKRQLSVPLNDMELTYDEFDAWESGLIKKNIITNPKEFKIL